MFPQIPVRGWLPGGGPGGGGGRVDPGAEANRFKGGGGGIDMTLLTCPCEGGDMGGGGGGNWPLELGC